MNFFLPVCPVFWFNIGMQQNGLHATIGRFETLVANRLPARKFSALLRRHHPHARRGRKLSLVKCMHAFIYHGLRCQGTLSQHVNELFGQDISDSALAQRRARLPWEVFARLLELALRPLAQPDAQPHAFYHRWRLVGVDGTQFSVRNTPLVLSSLSKAAARRMQAAFAKLGMAVFVELGTHNPLVAEIGREGECEQILAARMVARLPSQCLLLADRLYGVAKWVGRLQPVCESKQSQFLLRVAAHLNSKVGQRFSDGSALVELRYDDEQQGRQRVQVREIRGVVIGHDGRRRELRLWTSLLDAALYPGLELLELYAQRWEQELSYKELKLDVHGSELLASHSVHTAAQELACVLIAQSLVAELRAVSGATQVLRVSFAKLRTIIEGVWVTLAVGDGILSVEQEVAVVQRALNWMAQMLNPPRRARSCPRAVRQPVTTFPRLIQNASHKGPVHYEITPMPDIS